MPSEQEPVQRAGSVRGSAAGAAGCSITVRYWAGARAAAGTEQDVVTGRTVGDAVTAVTALHPALEPIAAVSTLLLGGRAVTREAVLLDGAVLEVLPPFAGG